MEKDDISSAKFSQRFNRKKKAPAAATAIIH